MQQRIRVGLTGLACVFLLVMLATAFLRMGGGADAGGNSIETGGNVSAPSEPLAQLGVAPGNVPPAKPAPASAAPKPVTVPGR